MAAIVPKRALENAMEGSNKKMKFTEEEGNAKIIEKIETEKTEEMKIEKEPKYSVECIKAFEKKLIEARRIKFQLAKEIIKADCTKFEERSAAFRKMREEKKGTFKWSVQIMEKIEAEN